jgi:very-short-patch-repair endonuclease
MPTDRSGALGRPEIHPHLAQSPFYGLRLRSTWLMDPVPFARFLGLEAILRGQQGVIRRDQALAAGMRSTRIDDLVRRGIWVRLLPRVFVVGVDPAHPRVRIRATWLWAGDTAVIAGQAAAFWWGLSSTPPQVVTVVVPPPARRANQPGVRVIRGTVHPSEADFEDWVKVTTIPRTSLDLARQREPDGLETALRLRRADRDRLELSLERSRGRRGQVMARLAVAEVAGNPWSFCERQAHQLLRAAGITGWEGNQPIRLRCGLRHPDIAIEEFELVIELDGRAHHTRVGAFDKDHARHNDFVREGWTVLGFTAKQVADQPREFIDTILETIEVIRRRKGMSAVQGRENQAARG